MRIKLLVCVRAFKGNACSSCESNAVFFNAEFFRRLCGSAEHGVVLGPGGFLTETFACNG